MEDQGLPSAQEDTSLDLATVEALQLIPDLMSNSQRLQTSVTTWQQRTLAINFFLMFLQVMLLLIEMAAIAASSTPVDRWSSQETPVNGV